MRDLARDWPALQVVPLTVEEANGYIAAIHRHNGPLPTARLAVGLIDSDALVRGVAIAGIPKARVLMARGTLEVSRVGTDGVRNGCSMLYAAITRAARALGYRRLVTYTLEQELGASLRASGWRQVSQVGGKSWTRRQQSNGNFFYQDAHDTGAKWRWEIALGEPIPDLSWPGAVSESNDPDLLTLAADDG